MINHIASSHVYLLNLVIFIVLFFVMLFLDSRYDIITEIVQITKHLSSSIIFLTILFISSFLIFSVFANSVLQRSPDHMYLFQAQTFHKGRLWNNPPPGDFFVSHSIITKDGKWLSRVFPGWPFLLSLAMSFHFPTWLLNPLLGTASLIVLFLLAKLLYNNTVGLLSVVSVLCSPFFIFNSASYVPHISCGLLILLAVYFYCSFNIKKASPAYLFWMGVCFGGAYLIRPFSTLCCLVPILIAMIIKRKGEFFQKDIWLLLLGMAPFLLINFAYNYFITGNFLISPFNWSNPQDTIRFKLSTVLANFDSAENQLLWMNPALFIMYFFTVIFLSFKKKIQTHELFFFLFFACCFFYATPGVSYGSRYYFEGYLLCVLCVIGRLSQYRQGNIKRLVTLTLITGFFTCFLLIPAYAIHYKNKMYEKNELFRLVKEKHLSNAIVFLPNGATPLSIRETFNDPDLQNKVLYANDLKEKNALILKYFPTRNIYRYVPGGKNDDQKLQKYEIPHNISPG